MSKWRKYDNLIIKRDSEMKKPQARNAANARERARMRVLSKAFTRLKTSLPWVPADTKLSKLDTLRLASGYISHLRQILQEEESVHSNPANLEWPFIEQQRLPQDSWNGHFYGNRFNNCWDKCCCLHSATIN